MIKAVDGKDKSLRELLSGAQYSIDYYQREYRWETKQVIELISDLTEKFMSSHKPDNVRSAIANYPAYFLGSIILSRKDSQNFIIDGQQRLTTITLLLIFLNNLQNEQEMAHDPNVEPMILSTQFGQRNLNIQVEERRAVLEALFSGSPLPQIDEDTTLATLVNRYEDIGENFPEECRGDALPYFMDWLIERVQLVEISAYSDEDAYTIFETMNDRGLSLSPADMLKGFVLSNIKDISERANANSNWKLHVSGLDGVFRDAQNDFFKTWMRGRMGETVGTTVDDFERLGPEFHRWFKDNTSRLNYIRSEDFSRFANEELPFYSRQYKRIRVAEDGKDPMLRTVHLNSFGAANIEAAFVLVAPLAPNDSPIIAAAKVALVSDYLDIFLMRRFWAGRTNSLPSLKGSFVPLARGLRACSTEEVAGKLLAELLKPGHDNFETSPPALVNTNRKNIHRLLARLTDFVEINCGTSNDRFEQFMARNGRHKFSIEHLLSHDFQSNSQHFGNEVEYIEWRNKLGALVLLPHTFNASYQDMHWEEKFPLYARPGHNVLAASLTDETYRNNPRLREFNETNQLGLRSYMAGSHQFARTEIDERTAVYRRLARLCWDPRRLLNPELVNSNRVAEIASEILGEESEVRALLAPED